MIPALKTIFLNLERKEKSSKFYNIFFIWASSRENLSFGVVKNTGADQPAHPPRLISAFVARFLESFICKLATGEILIL